MKRFFWFLNVLLAIITVVIYGLHYLPPSKQGVLLGTTLFLPICLLANGFFFVYWLLQLDKRIFLSILFLVISFSRVVSFVNLSSRKEEVKKGEKKLRIATYNAHYFWRQKGKKRSFFYKEFVSIFLNSSQLELFFVQESGAKSRMLWEKEFPYSFIKDNKNSIYSKYPILKRGEINWKGNSDRALFVDLEIGKDTIRAYNLHLGSYRYPKQSEGIAKKGFTRLYDRLGLVFKMHQEQIEKVINHIKQSPYPVIVCGDFNNLANSYPNDKLKDLGLKDTFIEAGSGLGATYEFSYFPLKIDYIFVPETVKVLSHKVIKTTDWSDHYPVVAEIAL